MFGTIIDIDKSGNILLNKKYIYLVPELEAVMSDKNLGGTMIKYIVNVYDKRSIWRHLPEDVRKEDVSENLFGKKKYPRCGHAKVQAAIKLYKYVQYDPIKAQYDSLVNKSAQKQKVYDAIEVTEQNLNELNNIEAKMEKSLNMIEKVGKKLETQEEENKIMGKDDTELSYIEERLIKYRKEETAA